MRRKTKITIIQTKCPPVQTSVALSVELGVVASVDLWVSKWRTWVTRFCDKKMKTRAGDVTRQVWAIFSNWACVDQVAQSKRPCLCFQAEGGPQVRLEPVPHQSLLHNQPLSLSSFYFQFELVDGAVPCSVEPLPHWQGVVESYRRPALTRSSDERDSYMEASESLSFCDMFTPSSGKILCAFCQNTQGSMMEVGF